MIDIVLNEARIPPRSPIRVRDHKCCHGAQTLAENCVFGVTRVSHR